MSTFEGQNLSCVPGSSGSCLLVSLRGLDRVSPPRSHPSKARCGCGRHPEYAACSKCSRFYSTSRLFRSARRPLRPEFSQGLVRFCYASPISRILPTRPPVRDRRRSAAGKRDAHVLNGIDGPIPVYASVNDSYRDDDTQRARQLRHGPVAMDRQAFRESLA